MDLAGNTQPTHQVGLDTAFRSPGCASWSSIRICIQLPGQQCVCRVDRYSFIWIYAAESHRNYTAISAECLSRMGHGHCTRKRSRTSLLANVKPEQHRI